MDLAKYELRAKPFQLNSDPEFLWLGEPYKEAFATLHTAVLENRGVLLLTGDVGSGKTILINALVERLLAEGTIVARLPYPNLEPADFFSIVATACDLPRGFAGRAAFLLAFRRFVRDADANGRRVLLVIDEAQSLTPSLFTEIERLADAGTYAGSPPKHLANILLAGQDHLCSVLLRSEHVRLAQAITVRCDLRSLTEAEVGEYIAHRVKVAGSERALFTAGAVRKIWALSGGSPGLINLISHRALLVAAGREAAIVNTQVLTDAAADVGALTDADQLRAATPGRSRAPGLAQTGIAARVRTGVLSLAGGAAVIGVALLVAGLLWPDRRPADTRREPRTSRPASNEPARSLQATSAEQSSARSARVGVAPGGPDGMERSEARRAGDELATAGPQGPAGLVGTGERADAPALKKPENGIADGARPPEDGRSAALPEKVLADVPRRRVAEAARRRPVRESVVAARPVSPRAPSEAASGGRVDAQVPPLRRSVGSQPAEPDPAAIIDWLLNDRPPKTE